MFVLDAWSVSHARRLPAQSASRRLGRFTDLGKSGWFLWPTGILLLVLAALDSPACRGSRAACWRPGRCGWASSSPRSRLPSLFATIVKRLIGRARPFVAGNDVWAYRAVQLGTPDYASLPSGHATTAFAALVAIGAIFPQARALMWIYAVLIALSRVIVTAHHPSDVIAGAIVGAVGRATSCATGSPPAGSDLRSAPTVRCMRCPARACRRIIKAVARRLHSA